MRIRQSLKAFVPFLLMLAAGRSAQAQQGPPMPSQGIPSGYNVYQRESAYQNLFQQHYQSDGLWTQNSNNGFGAFNQPRNWYMGLEYLRTRTRDLQGTIGADGVQTYHQQSDPANNGIVDGLEFYNFFNAADANMIPVLKTDGLKLSGGFWNADGSGLLLNASFNNENTATMDARRNAMAARPVDSLTALRLRRNGGVDVGGPFNASGRNDRDIVENEILAPGQVFDTTDSIGHGFFGSTFDVLDRTVLNLFGMPVLSANTPLIQNGETVPYDLDFIIQHSIQTFQGGAVWAFTPIYDRGGITVRPVFGGRYMSIDETFRFYGASTLLAYGLDNADADTPINTKVFPPGDGIDDDGDFIPDTTDEPSDTVNTTGTTFSPLTGLSNHLIVRSFINSKVQSDLAGPEFGLQYDLGSTGALKLSGSTRVGALFNNERLRLRGDNIGNFMGIEVIPDPITGANISTRMFDTETTNGPSQNAFADTDSSSHLSPMFEQGLNLNVPLFSRVPVLKDMWQFEDAALTVGWSYLLIGEVADPNDSIIYQSSPITGILPQISPERDNFTQTTWSIGLNWTY
jgi:hypothetical protein